MLFISVKPKIPANKGLDGSSFATSRVCLKASAPPASASKINYNNLPWAPATPSWTRRRLQERRGVFPRIPRSERGFSLPRPGRGHGCFCLKSCGFGNGSGTRKRRIWEENPSITVLAGNINPFLVLRGDPGVSAGLKRLLPAGVERGTR